MKHAPVIAVLGVMCALPAAAQTITVSKPVAGATCTEGQACAIAWTVTGQPGSTGIIELLEETTTNVVRVIKSDAQIMNLQYSWTVPANLAAKYRVRVRIAWLVVSPPGGVFTIKAQSGGSHPPLEQVGQKAEASKAIGHQAMTAAAPVRILSPSPGVTWEVGKTYMINWTADTKPDDGFTVDLCNEAGVKVRNLLDGAAQRRPDGSWLIWGGVQCLDPEGFYKIRVTSWYAKKGALSGKITAVIKTRKIVKNIPVHSENAELLLSNTGSSNMAVDCEQADQRNRARVGRYGSQIGVNFGWSFLRARLTFDLSELKKKTGEVESATLIPGDMNTCPSSSAPFCFGSLFAMNAGDVNTWNRLKVQANTPLYPLTGWTSPIAPAAGGIDITTPVREWVKGTKPNHGFVVTGVGEPACGCAPEKTGLFQSSCSYKCITHFKPIMYVTFIEKPDPCGAH